MMRKGKINDTTTGGLLLLLLLLILNILRGAVSLAEPDREVSTTGIFVQVSGDIKQPGVYGFCQPPRLKDLLARAGDPGPMGENESPLRDILLTSGKRIDVKGEGKEIEVFESEMSAFYKVTLGLPVSINAETMEGLTAVPGIGLKIASEIVVERARRGGFQKLEEILSIHGIGPATYRKIRPYLGL